jgi:bifunctional DNA-binding transcriptional regulator/antitoxin component of YhaV-PrlF toxin-antitoxin module
MAVTTPILGEPKFRHQVSSAFRLKYPLADHFSLCYTDYAENLHKGAAMDTTIQIRERGVITLPAELREKYNLETGNVLHLVDLEGVFAFTPMTPVVPELAKEIERLRLEAGLSIEDLLQDLRAQRERYNQEKYGR